MSFFEFSALLCANSCDILTWTTETIDGILIKGDSMDLKAFDERSIPDEETISHLPDRIISSTIATTINQTITKRLNCVNSLIRGKYIESATDILIIVPHKRIKTFHIALIISLC